MQMMKAVVSAGVVLAIGCGQSVSTPAPYAEGLDAPMRTSGGEIAVEGFERVDFDPADGWDEDAFTIAELPPAPWSGAPVVAGEIPAQVHALWTARDESCAPLGFEGVDVATATASALDGGWSLEFEGSDGYGLAGIALEPEAASPSFDDGSVVIRESDEGVASATIQVGREGCVYQVWSFRGEEHLDELIGGLRRVALPTTPTNLATR